MQQTFPQFDNPLNVSNGDISIPHRSVTCQFLTDSGVSQAAKGQYLMRRFGEKLRTLRRQQHMTLKELAAALGHAAHGYISEIESGKKKPTVELVLSVARLFEVSTDALLFDELELPPIQVKETAE